MRILKHLLGVLSLVTLLWSCASDLFPEGTLPEGSAMSIECELQGYAKATDTSFEEGDEIGLYVYLPESFLDNEKYTCRNGKFSPETPHMWYEGNEESEFIAYYPYQKESWGTDRTIRFCINADQRTHRNYTASDLMVARKRARPGAEAVVLPFVHVLSKALITIDNRLDEDIAEVMFSGVKGSFTYHVDSSRVVLDGKTGIVKAARSNADPTQWAMVLPPQTADPKLILITTGQKEYEYSLDRTFRLEAGKCHSATITVDAGSVSTEISTDIQDWQPGNDFNFGQDTTPGGGDSLRVDLSVRQNPHYPEGELFLKVRIQGQIQNYRVRYSPVNDSTVILSPNQYFAPAGSLQSAEGQVVNITALEPSTEYRMTVSVTALDQKVHNYEISCMTAPEPSYTFLGKGTFIDNTQFISWSDEQGNLIQKYETTVDIYQDSGNPDKFRMMAPYRNYWANADPGFVKNQLPMHNGKESAYVDFYRYVGSDGRVHVAFSEMDTGATAPEYPGSSYYYSALGEITYDVNQHCYVQSVEMKDGVFNLNPVSAYIRNTSLFFGYLDFGHALQILLPQPDDNEKPDVPGQGTAFDYFEVPQTLKAKPEYRYILHSGETYTSHQKVRNYSACYDTRRHNPMWVAYPCHDIWGEGGFGRPDKDPWRPDPDMKESEQSIIYANDWSDWPWSSSGGRPVDNKQYWTPSWGASFYFTKGHLMRSAERGTKDRYNLFKMNEQTFYPTNISPERYPVVKRTSDNRKISHWALVEGIMPNEWICSDTLYVVAGCYYGDDSYTAVDASDNGARSPDSKECTVPVARWKVFLRTKSGVTGKPVSLCRADELMAIAFWFPQSLDPSNQVPELPPLSDYTLSVDDLEARIGGEFNFFPKVPAEVSKTFTVSDWPGLDRIINVRIDSGYNGPYIY